MPLPWYVHYILLFKNFFLAQLKSWSSDLTQLGKLKWASKSLAERPIRWHDIVENKSLAVGGGDGEGESLGVQVGVGLPIRPPIPRHRDPSGSARRPLDRHRLDWPTATHVGHQHQLEVVAAIDGEPHSPLLHTRNSTIVELINLAKYKNK